MAHEGVKCSCARPSQTVGIASHTRLATKGLGRCSSINHYLLLDVLIDIFPVAAGTSINTYTVTVKVT